MGGRKGAAAKIAPAATADPVREWLRAAKRQGVHVDAAPTAESAAMLAGLAGAEKVLVCEPRPWLWPPAWPQGVCALHVELGAKAGAVVLMPPTAPTRNLKQLPLAAPTWPAEPVESTVVTLDDLCVREAPERPVGYIRLGGPEERAVAVLQGASTALSRWRPHVLLDATDAATRTAVGDELAAYRYVSGLLGPRHVAYAPARVHVTVVAFNRPTHLANLLGDLGRECNSNQPGHHSLAIYDDCSSSDMSVPRQLAERLNGAWWRAPSNYGKKGFWRLWCKVLADCREQPADTVFVFLPDDVRLCEGFRARALGAWNELLAPDRAALNLLADTSRDACANWTAVTPVRVSARIWRTQWVDGLFLCQHRALARVGYRIAEQLESRWLREPHASSGVWQWFSQRLHAQGLGMYRVHESLAVHVVGPSMMNPRVRRAEPLVATRFADGEASHARLLAAEPVEASLATIPSRAAQLKLVVDSLVPQVTVLRVYLNAYPKVPAFLSPLITAGQVVVARSQDHGDRGDAGKFHWCEQGRGYQLTCDDDLVYPPGYVAHMVRGVERYGRRAVVGLHGIVLEQPLKTSYYRSRALLHWRHYQKADRVVHLLGTGVMAYYASALSLTRSVFEVPNMADIWVGLTCQQQGVPAVALSHPAKWLRYLQNTDTIYDRTHLNDGPQTAVVRRISWRLLPLPK